MKGLLKLNILRKTGQQMLCLVLLFAVTITLAAPAHAAVQYVWEKYDAEETQIVTYGWKQYEAKETRISIDRSVGTITNANDGYNRASRVPYLIVYDTTTGYYEDLFIISANYTTSELSLKNNCFDYAGNKRIEIHDKSLASTDPSTLAYSFSRSLYSDDLAGLWIFSTSIDADDAVKINYDKVYHTTGSCIFHHNRYATNLSSAYILTIYYDAVATISDTPTYEKGAETGYVATSLSQDAYPSDAIFTDTQGNTFWYGQRYIYASDSTYKRGSTKLGTVTSVNPSAYPASGKQGSYWYELKESYEDTSSITYIGGEYNSALGTQSVPIGKEVALSKAYTAAPQGWSFYGWAESDSTATRKYTADSKVTLARDTSLTLYAIYCRNINFIQDGGTTATADKQQFMYGGGTLTAVKSPAITVPSSGNWTAIGWYSDTTATNSYTVKQSTSFTPARDAGLYYATFKRTLTVSYNINGGKSGTTANTTATQYYNTSGALSSNTMTLAANGFTAQDNKAFGKWGTTASGGTQYAAKASYTGIGGSKTAANNVTLYAIWASKNTAPVIQTQPTNTASIYGDGGSVSVLATAVGTLSYQWQTSADGINSWSNISGATGRSYVYPANTTVGTKFYRCVVSSSLGSEAVAKTTSAAVSATVSQREVSVMWGSNTMFEYDGTEHIPSVAVSNISSNASTTYTLTGKGTNAGSYTAAVTLADTTNYRLPTNDKQPFVITPRTLTVSWGAQTSFVYDGQAHVPEVIVSNTLGTTEPYTVSGSATTPGAYTATVALKSGYATNYSLVSGYTQKFVITKRTVSLAWGNDTFVYDGQPHTPSVTVGNTVGSESVSATVVGSGTESGSYTAEVTGITKSNLYQLPVGTTKAFIINKAPKSNPGGSEPWDPSDPDNPPFGPPGDGVNSQFYHGARYVFAAGSGERILATNVAPADPSGIVTVSSSDITKVTASLSGGVLRVTPVSATGAVTPATITLASPATDNYEGYQLTAYVYVSDGPTVTATYSTLLSTKDNVEVTIKAEDPYTAIDPTHIIQSVTVNGTDIGSSGNNRYIYTFTDNAAYMCTVTDSAGGYTSGLLKVDWIDREAPNVMLSAMQKADGGILMQAQASDNASRYSDLEYCWDYVSESTAVWRSGMSTKVYAGGSVARVAVRDLAGNVTVKSAEVVYTPIEDIAEEVLVMGQRALKNVLGDISGYVFGQTLYLDSNGLINSYESSPVRLRLRIEPVSEKTTVEGYLTINNSKLQVKWYLDEGLVNPLPLYSTDGKSIPLAKGKCYGVVDIDPAVVATATKKNASAVINLITYSDAGRAKKLTSEQYAMTYSVDLTPPNISMTYNAYERSLNVRATDALSGIANNQATLTVQGNAPQVISPIMTLQYPTAGDMSAFSVTVSAKDKLGNEASETKTFTPSSTGSGSGGGSTGVFNSDTDGLNTAFSRSRLFNKYLVNGTHSNSGISSVPDN